VVLGVRVRVRVRVRVVRVTYSRGMCAGVGCGSVLPPDRSGSSEAHLAVGMNWPTPPVQAVVKW
jgi:hypothetical protein